MFDLNMIIENAKKYNLEFNFKTYYDTLDLARRLLDLDNYKLSKIAKKLNFKSATHSADDDVAATIDLLLYSVDRLKQSTEKRIALWNKFKTKFITTAVAISNWEKQIDKLRPAEFLDYIYLESGLKDYYEKDKNADQRIKSFSTLKCFLMIKMILIYQVVILYINLIRFSSLAKNIDFLGLEQGRIPIVTIHQVKGLEFDYIFLRLK
jgi:DNA polymerase III alpha subunit (gram-positive type)